MSKKYQNNVIRNFSEILMFLEHQNRQTCAEIVYNELPVCQKIVQKFPIKLSRFSLILSRIYPFPRFSLVITIIMAIDMN